MTQIIWIILLILLIVISWKVTEGFAPTLSDNFVQNYQQFVEFYNPFQVNWEKAVITVSSMDTEQEPLTDPTASPSSVTPPTPSRSKLNQVIRALSTKEGKPFPPITDPLPNQVTSDTISSIMDQIPTDPQPYQNALEWMNSNLSTAQKDLEKALKGEGFENCDLLSQCMAGNPEFVANVVKAQKEQEAQQTQYKQEVAGYNLDKFTKNASLMNAASTNQNLIEKSKKIQNQAQSGELLNQIDLPKEPATKYNIPAGGNALAEMKQNNPAEYEKYEKSGGSIGPFFRMKQLFEQINRNLR